MQEGRPGGLLRGTVLVAGFLQAVLAVTPAAAVNLKAGDAAHEFSVPTLAGGRVALGDYQGEVVMVMFWSTWCSRCREELDFMKTMQARYPAVRFLALNAETEAPREQDLARMRKVVEEWELPFVVGVDEGLKVWALYKVNALPTSMIIGTDGRLVFIEPNFHFESPQAIEAALRSAVGADVPD